MSDKGFEVTALIYDELPWYRKRCFLVLPIFFVTPITLLICLTGDLCKAWQGGLPIFE